MKTPRDTSCVLCGSKRQRVLHNRARDREGVLNVICKRCGMVFISPRPTLAELDAIYSSGQFSREARGSERPDDAKVAQSEENARRRHETIRGFLAGETPTQGRRALDIGCGIGSLLHRLAGEGWNVEGLEPDPNYAGFGGEKYGIDIKPLMFEDYPERPGSLDLIMTFHVLEHVLTPGPFVEKAARLLKPGGRLYIEVPCIERPYEGNLDFFFWSVHVNTFSSNTLTAFLERVGFDDVRCDYAGHSLWIVGTRPEVLVPREVSYPCDDPEVVLRRTRSAHAEFYLKTYRHPLKRRGLAYWAVRKLLTRPADVLPAIRRRVGRGRHWAS